MESDFNGSSLGQMIVDKVNQTYPGYEMTVQVRKEDKVKCVALREIMRLGNVLPLSFATDATWGNGQNLKTKVRNIIKTKPSDDPLHAICKKIEEHWGKGNGKELVELEKGMPVIIMQLSKLPSPYKILKELSAFIRAKTGDVDEDEEENVPPPDEPRMDEAPADEPSADEPSMETVRKDVPEDKLVAAMNSLKIRLDRAKPTNMAKIRVTADYKMSAIDVIRIVYEHSDGGKASEIFRGLDQDVKNGFKEKVQFSGPGQKETPVGGIRDIIYMVLHLNSKLFCSLARFLDASRNLQERLNTDKLMPLPSFCRQEGQGLQVVCGQPRHGLLRQHPGPVPEGCTGRAGAWCWSHGDRGRSRYQEGIQGTGVGADQVPEEAGRKGQCCHHVQEGDQV
jgi:hypothetical protein